MRSGPGRPVTTPEPRPGGRAPSDQGGPAPSDQGGPGPNGPLAGTLDEPPAVIATGPCATSRAALLAALLGTATPLVRVPDGSYLRIRYGAPAGGVAYLPGQLQPQPCPDGRARSGAGPALARPPRRTEITAPAPLLRHFDLVDSPAGSPAGPAGRRILLDVLDRGGALLLVLPADRRPGTAERELLVRAAGTAAAIFLVFTPAADGSWTGPGPCGEGEALPGPSAPHGAVPDGRLAAHRAAAVAAAPALAGVPWFAVDPATGDTALLKRALTEWASLEGLHRTGARAAGDTGRPIRVAPAGVGFDWADLVEREVRTATYRIREQLALELANVHLRGVQEVVFGAGCPGFPAALDRELHALSLNAVAECDEAVEQLLESVVVRVFGETSGPAVRRRIARAVTRGFADLRGARDLDRALLVTGTGGLALLTGPGAVDAFAAYPGGRTAGVLPPLGIGLSSGCYRMWCDPSAEPGQARSWLQRVLREIELELLREVTRRLQAVRLSLTAVLGRVLARGSLLV